MSKTILQCFMDSKIDLCEYVNDPTYTLKHNEDSIDEAALGLTVEDFIAGQNPALDVLPADFVDPIPTSGKFEGDIDLGGKPIDYYVDYVVDDSPSAHRRMHDVHVQHSAIRGHHFRWEDAVIPYTLAPTFGQDRSARAIIAAAVMEYEKHTCIKWVHRRSQSDYVHFVKGEGCHSPVGRIGGRQIISLGTGCMVKGVVMHEMMHAVGFYHEQSRTDRDTYVTIKWENMELRRDNINFLKLGVDYVTDLGTKYDYGSLMHYGTHDFSIMPVQLGGVCIVLKKPFSLNVLELGAFSHFVYKCLQEFSLVIGYDLPIGSLTFSEIVLEIPFFAPENGRATIITRNGEKIGQTKRFSQIDIEDLNKMYKCGEKKRQIKKTGGSRENGRSKRSKKSGKKKESESTEESQEENGPAPIPGSESKCVIATTGDKVDVNKEWHENCSIKKCVIKDGKAKTMRIACDFSWDKLGILKINSTKIHPKGKYTVKCKQGRKGHAVPMKRYNKQRRGVPRKWRHVNPTTKNCSKDAESNTTTKEVTDKCYDRVPRCDLLAQQGACLPNSNDLQYCRNTCRVGGCQGYAGKGGYRCADYHYQCQQRASRGDCLRFPRYMHQVCRISCNSC